MNINIKSTNLELTPSLKEYALKKISSISRFLKKFEEQKAILVDVELSRTTKHHRKGEIFYAEVNLHLPKKFLRAEEYRDDLRTAIDKVKDKLRIEIEKYKETF